MVWQMARSSNICLERNCSCSVDVDVDVDVDEPKETIGDDSEAAVTTSTVTKVVPIPVPHENILWHLLVNAERSWAHANELQKAHKTKRRQPVLKKLKRANKWARLLVGKARISADEETQKECEAYAAWMSANYALEQMQYQAASKGYAHAMSLCHELSGENDSGNNANDQTDDVQRLERHDLFITRADTILRPLFRYSQYELKQAGQPTIEEPRLQSSGQQQEQDDQDSIVFRDRELILDNKDLRVLLLKLQSVEQEEKEEAEKESTSAQKETQFLTALSILDDATEVVQSLEQGLSKAASSSGPAVQAKLQQYALWRGYLQCTKIGKVMEHTENLLTVDSAESMGPAEKVHVYDAILQHAKSLLNLPQPEDGSGGGANEDDEFILQVQANILRLRALKTYHMGWCYYTQLFKYGPALALLEHSDKLSKRAQEEIAACDEDMPHAEEYLQQLEDLPLESSIGAIRAAMVLQQRQHARKLQKAASAAAANGEAPSRWQEPVTTDRPLLLRLYEYDGGTPDAPIADLRPMPLPCKPVFYDLAYGHALDTANSMDALENFLYQHTAAPVSNAVENEEKDAGSGGGLSGGLLGWLTGK
mmetsp:Transcript_13942/g.29372  ORF Transcript_13942/g.29372 Transcript_13942/m.29372 type:complete len:595 (-) Transcript_13942:435-2219(-)